MDNRYRSAYFLAVFFAAVVLLLSPAAAFTDPLDVVALRDLFKTLNQPEQLTGWKSDAGDPCDDSWHGVSCFGGFSVINLKLNGLNLSGYITPEIYNLYSLKQLDISSNTIGGEIPYVLPQSATHINLAYNHLIQNIPSSISQLTNLESLNLSHNWLSGPIGDVFTSLHNLKEMDLSYNNFTGDLPSSFQWLESLTRLFIQNNRLTGSLDSLGTLYLYELNAQCNDFVGEFPEAVKLIPFKQLLQNCSTHSQAPSPSPPSPKSPPPPNDDEVRSPPSVPKQNKRGLNVAVVVIVYVLSVGLTLIVVVLIGLWVLELKGNREWIVVVKKWP